MSSACTDSFEDFEFDPELEVYYDYYKESGDLLGCDENEDNRDLVVEKNIDKIMQNQLDKEKEDFYNEEDEIDASFQELIAYSVGYRRN